MLNNSLASIPNAFAIFWTVSNENCFSQPLFVSITVQQVMPIAKEGINEMAPTIGNVAGEIAKVIHNGINESDKEEK